jgi:TonB family protein
MRTWITVLMGILMGSGCTEPAPEVPPRQISESPFHYPEELWDAGVEGETILEIHVSAVGTVDSARVEQTSGHEEFDSAAVSGAQRLRFEPARRGDETVAVRVLLPVQFHMPPGDSLSESLPPEP